MKIYAAKTYKIDSAGMEKLWCLLDSDRQRKVSALRNEKEKERSIFAGLLLRSAFLEAGYSEQEWQSVRIEKGAYGKPSIKEYQDFHYSLSHSGEWIICSVDKKPVGADIQEMAPWKLQLAKRFYSKEEYNRLLEIQDQDQRTKMFYHMWSAKESAAKMTGIGIGHGIDHFVTDVDFNFIYDVENSRRIQIRLYDEIEGYAVCACSKTGVFPEKIDWTDCGISKWREDNA